MIRPQIPDGFREFWTATASEAESCTLDYEIGPVSRPEPSRTGQTDPGTISAEHEIRSFSFRGIAGEQLNGWVALPEVTVAPAFLWLAPYGRESVMPNQYGTRRGYASLSFNYFGLEPFREERYTPDRGYFVEGVQEPATWIFRRMFQNAAIAGRVLADLPQVDAAHLGSMGMSQGGGMSIWLGAWCSRIKAVCADLPFLGGMHETLMKNVYRYPLKELMDFVVGDPVKRDLVMETISFFDTLNQALFCDKPTLVSLGLKDPAVKPIQARSIFEALPGEKRRVEYSGGHDWDVGMIANNRDWFDRWL